jgi:hypothetical protein
MSTERENLIARQFHGYPHAHRERVNLAVHLATVPVFIAGGATLAVALAAGAYWIALAGAVAMPLAIGIQGATHRREPAPPSPFDGPLDVLLRIFAEQWITFPRFVITGGFARAWRAARSTEVTGALRSRARRSRRDPSA